MARSRSARLDMTWRANIGVSWTRKRNRRLSMTASLQSSTATAVALRADVSTRAISPKVSSGPIVDARPSGSRSSTLPSTTPNISSPVEPASKMTVPAGTSLVSVAALNTPRTFAAMDRPSVLPGATGPNPGGARILAPVRD